MADRKSQAESATLIEDRYELAQREASNALDQFDWGIDEVKRWIAVEKPSLRVSTLLTLHRKAMEGIDKYAGNFRPTGVAISGSAHEPVSGDDVPRHVEEMLDYIARNWEQKTALHLSAYAMWRLNWIHPFSDGNGRTSRIFSYMVLCGRLGQILPGRNTIPEQISKYKKPYYQALEKADENWKNGATDVSAMESLLEEYLATQLVEIHEDAKNGIRVKRSSGGEIEFLDKDERPVRFKDKRHWIIEKIEGHSAIATIIATIFVAIITIIFTR